MDKHGEDVNRGIGAIHLIADDKLEMWKSEDYVSQQEGIGEEQSPETGFGLAVAFPQEALVQQTTVVDIRVQLWLLPPTPNKGNFANIESCKV